MATLPNELKRIRLELPRSKEFSEGSATHGYGFVAPLDAAGHISPMLWQKNTASAAALFGSGATRNKLDYSRTCPLERNTDAGCSTMTAARSTTMSQATGSVSIHFGRANTSRCAIKMMRCTRSAS